MIRAFVGRNGGGKSLAMTYLMAMVSWAMGRVVISNFRLYPEAVGYPAHLHRMLGESIRAVDPAAEKWLEIPRLGEYFDGGRKPKMHPDGGLWSLTGNQGCTLLLDEITSVLPARDAVNVPQELQRMLNQFRKPDVWLGWAAPAWERADLMLREVTQTVTECRPFMPAWTQKNIPGQRWPIQRAFQFIDYDAFEYEEFHRKAGDIQKYDLRQEGRTILWKPKVRKLVQSAYDTREGVDLLDHISCENCGGKRARKVCKCGEGSYKSKGAPALAAVPALAAASVAIGLPALPEVSAAPARFVL